MRKNRRLKDYLLFGEAWLLLATARFMLFFLPFKKIVPLLGKVNRDDNVATEHEDHTKLLSSIKLAVDRACRYSPWRTMCFEQALAAKMMLRLRRVVSTVFFGVYKDTDNQLKAHAWLKSHNFTVTGGGNLDSYTVLSSFKS